jgi:hypothetical protein
MTPAVLAASGSRKGIRVFPEHQHLRDRPRISQLDHLTIQEILALLPQLPVWPEAGEGERGARLRGAAKILSWLQDARGDGWQERWQNSGADHGTGWIDDLIAADPRSREHKRDEIRGGLVALLCCRVMLPSYDFLTAYKAYNLFTHTRVVISPEVFARVEQAGVRRGMEGRQLAEALTILSKIVLHTGRNLDEVTADDVLEIRAWLLSHLSRARGGIHAAWELLADTGILPVATTLRSALRAGPRPTAELVDRYQIRCRPVRDLLVRYLEDRRPGLDYGSFRTLTGVLAGTFWADIEQHHPGITTLNLPDDVAVAWKQRLHYVTSADGSRRPRRNRLAILMQVRALYLDIQEWALEDPSWVPWAVPSPVRRGDTDGRRLDRAPAAVDPRARHPAVRPRSAPGHHRDDRRRMAGHRAARRPAHPAAPARPRHPLGAAGTQRPGPGRRHHHPGRLPPPRPRLAGRRLEAVR